MIRREQRRTTQQVCRGQGVSCTPMASPRYPKNDSIGRYPQMHPLKLTRRIGIRTGLRSCGAIVTGLALSLLCSGTATAQENPDPSLNGVSRSFIEANGQGLANGAISAR